MLAPSRSPRLLLLLLLFLAALSGRSVRCQSVRLDVFTEYVEAAWDKVGGWYGQDDFTVTITTPESSCSRKVHCTAAPCKFSSKTCGTLTPCSSNEVNVSSSNGASWASPFQTAPEPVTDLDVQVVEGFLHISWTNPSNESSTCYNDTAVRISYAVNTTMTTHHPIEEESLEVPLCEANTGEVQVWTTGGNGRSEVNSSSYTYNEYDVYDVLTLKTCQAKGCFGIDLAWEFNRVCPYITKYCVYLHQKQVICMNNTTTSHHVPDLKEGWFYSVHFVAFEQERQVWTSDRFYGCQTHDTAVTNLLLERPTPTTLKASWNPPACLSAKSLLYGVMKATWSCDSSFQPEDTTNKTSYLWAGLEDCEQYYICVAAEGNSPGLQFTRTLPRRPTWLELKMAGNGIVGMEWEAIECDGLTQYVVTWGSELHYTKDAEYTIEGYNSTEALDKVCVAAYVEAYFSLPNATGPTRCSDDPGQRPKDSSSPNVLLIVLLSVGIPVVIAAVVGVVLFIRWKRQKQQS